MSTHSNKVLYSPANVPFSWENKPGVSKAKETQCLKKEDFVLPKLPPPPCPLEQSQHDFQLPLPPCTFQPLSRSTSLQIQDYEDPFLLAFQECTKPAKLANKGGKTSSSSQKNYAFGSGNKGGKTSSSSQKNYAFGSGLRSLFAGFFCKRSSSVRDDSLSCKRSSSVRDDSLSCKRSSSVRDGSLSCKRSSSVRDDSLVRVSKLPYQRDKAL